MTAILQVETMSSSVSPQLCPSVSAPSLSHVSIPRTSVPCVPTYLPTGVPQSSLRSLHDPGMSSQGLPVSLHDHAGPPGCGCAAGTSSLSLPPSSSHLELCFSLWITLCEQCEPVSSVPTASLWLCVCLSFVCTCQPCLQPVRASGHASHSACFSMPSGDREALPISGWREEGWVCRARPPALPLLQ